MRYSAIGIVVVIVGCNSPTPQQTEPEITPADERLWSTEKNQESPEELRITRLFGSEAAQQTVNQAKSVEYFLLDSREEVRAKSQAGELEASGLAGIWSNHLCYKWDADLSGQFVPILKCRYQGTEHIVDVLIDWKSKVVEFQVNGQVTGRAKLSGAIHTKFRMAIQSIHQKHFPNEEFEDR